MVTTPPLPKRGDTVSGKGTIVGYRDGDQHSVDGVFVVRRQSVDPFAVIPFQGDIPVAVLQQQCADRPGVSRGPSGSSFSRETLRAISETVIGETKTSPVIMASLAARLVPAPP